MEKSTRPGVNFDTWLKLARDDPSGFETLRKRVLEDAIGRAPQPRQHRLRGLQWRVDQARQRAPNPMAACVSISRMMWESLAGSNGLIESLQAGPKQRRRAKILPLSRSR